MLTLQDNAITQNFVSPSICKDLSDLGLFQDTPYRWIIRDDGFTKLDTYSFDRDGYYMEGDIMVERFNPTRYKIPAYTIKDVESLLPTDYLITCNAFKEYEVSLSQLYHIDSAKSHRLPDALALLVKSSIRNGIILVRVANTILSTQAIASS